MTNKELNKVVGGNDCLCGCIYAGEGGSSMASNGSANNQYNYMSPGGGVWY